MVVKRLRDGAYDHSLADRAAFVRAPILVHIELSAHPEDADRQVTDVNDQPARFRHLLATADLDACRISQDGHEAKISER